jgi:DNA-binding transcriptional ArsR family regulator
VQLQSPFSLLGPSVDAGVLAVLAQADATFSATQVQRLSPVAVSPAGVRRALARLVGQGIVESERHANAFVYRLNRQHLAAPAVVALAHLREEFLHRLSDRLTSLATPLVYAAVFGSAARGTMEPGSDIDVFLVRRPSSGTPSVTDDTWRTDVAALERDVTTWTGNDTRVLSFTADELTGPNRPVALLENVAHDGVPLVGDEAWLRRLLRT